MATFESISDAQRLSARAIGQAKTEPAKKVIAPELAEVSARPLGLRLPKIHLPFIRLRLVMYYPLAALHEALDWAFVAGIGFFLLLLGLQFPHDPELDKFWVIVETHALGDPLVTAAFTWASEHWPYFGFSPHHFPAVLGFTIWALKKAVNVVFSPLLDFLRQRPAPERPLERSTSSTEEWRAGLGADSEQARELMLKRYCEIEGALRAAKRKRCAFLSVDVVGSTQMKESEKELAVTVTFQAYMKMLQDIFQEFSAWKHAWTPDGVMVCFLHIDLAVAAAQALLRRLKTFNRTENLLRTGLAVRCGLNEGEVPIFEDSKLERIAHHVIDVTGHLQKHARPNALWLSTEAHHQLEDKSGFWPTGKSVDGQEVYEWSPSLSGPEHPLPGGGPQEN